MREIAVDFIKTESNYDFSDAFIGIKKSNIKDMFISMIRNPETEWEIKPSNLRNNIIYLDEQAKCNYRNLENFILGHNEVVKRLVLLKEEHKNKYGGE